MEEKRHPSGGEEEAILRAEDNLDTLNDSPAEAEAEGRMASARRQGRYAPFGIVMLTAVILLGAICSVSYYFMEYWGARAEYNIVHDDCRAAEEDLR